MRIKELTLYNFMPYYGEHVLSLSASPTRNVTVVFGDNERGKTSLLNAIRWCFYGYALGRESKQLSLAKMINMDAVDRGDYRMHVYVRFEAQGHDYDLRRVAKLRDLVMRPRSDSDFEVAPSLRRDGTPLTGEEIEHEINQLIPEQVSRFFLFDGELLREYEALLTEDTEQARQIRTAIEQILGVPALLHGREELRTLLKEAQKVQVRDNKHIEGVRAAAEEQLRIQSRLESLRADLTAMVEQAAETRREIAELDEYLDGTAAVQKAKAEADSLERRVREMAQREIELADQKKQALENAWKDLLQPRLQSRITALAAEQRRLQAVIEQAGSLKERMRQLRKTISQPQCALCGREVSPATKEAAGAELGRLEGELESISADVGRLGSISEELSSLSRLRSTGAAARVRSIEAELARTAIQMTRADSDLTSLREQIAGHDTAEIARKRTLRDQKLQILGRRNEHINQRNEEIEKLTAEYDQLSKVMSKNPAARSHRSNREVQMYSALEQIFARSIDVLRDRLRRVVEEAASRTFLRLTTDRSYRGLQINESYGLSLIDREGRIKELRSSGAEQVVALALIDGLNKTSGKTGPIVIDTPFGRLDPKHRRNVLTEMPNLGEQVLILAHEGELTREGLEPIADRVGAVFQIRYISSSQSRIESALVEVA